MGLTDALVGCLVRVLFTPVSNTIKLTESALAAAGADTHAVAIDVAALTMRRGPLRER